MGSLYLWGCSIQGMGGDVVIGCSIYGVVVIDGSLYSRFYGMQVRLPQNEIASYAYGLDYIHLLSQGL